MARKAKSSNYQSRTETPENEDDTKFYIKFKDPRSKSQIFYYFDEEDIFDPCIPLNQGDIVNDSTAVAVEPKKPTESKKAPSPLAKTNPRNFVAPYFEESTLQVTSASILPTKKTIAPKPINLDDSFEDVGYMTAMDLKYVPDDDEEEEKIVLSPKINFTKKINKVDTEVYQELEEYIEPIKPVKQNILQLRTAIETVGDSKENSFVLAIPLSKEEFDKNSAPKDSPEYKTWIENHFTKNSLPARQISPAEFRLLKKMIGLKTK